jgi:lipid-A-disaccharide synthase
VKYYIIAGEPSGDKHGGKLINAIKLQDSDAQFRFWGGDDMANASKQSPFVHVKEMAFMGFIEVVKNIVTILHFFSKAKKDIHTYHPDVVIFIDYPGFNLRMAKWAKRQGFKTIYYVSPTVWAWHKSRVYDIEKYVDLLICILPFEIDFYKDYKVNAIYCGNPIVDEVAHFTKDTSFLQKHSVGRPILALLPGSRLQEINLILPAMLKSAQSLSDTYQVVIAKADNIDASIYNHHLSDAHYSTYKLIAHNYYNILAHARLAAVTSGTATLETAIFGVPQVVCYKTSPLSYAIAKRLVTLKFISLVNLIAGKELVKELIQDDCTPDNILAQLNLLSSKDKSMYSDVSSKLGEDGSAKKIATAIVQFVHK